MIKAKDYFEQNQASAKECFETTTIKVENVKAGDTMFIDMGIPAHVRAPEDGYRVEGQNGLSRFFSIEDFENEVKPFFNEYEIKGNLELPKDAVIEEVKKGQQIYTQPWSDTEAGVHSKATQDGYLVTLPEDGNPRFYSNTNFAATFNASAHGITPEPQGQFMRYVSDKAVKYVVVKEDVTFDFEEGAYEVKAGEVLVENEQDIDGFTIYQADTFFEIYELPSSKDAPSHANDMTGPS